MQLALNLELTERKTISSTDKNFQLTERDYQIMAFITNMKFSTVEMIFEKFFRISQAQAQSTTYNSCYRRLLVLEQNKLLHSTRNYLTAEKVYIASWKSYFFLKQKSEFAEQISYPIKKVDIRTFEHDFKLQKIRLKLESDRKITNWISDRYIKTHTNFRELSKLNIVPDAIYTNSDGEKVALELELTLKSKERYRAKIRNTVQFLRSQNKQAMFSRIIFLCDKRSVAETINRETQLYRNYFQVIELKPDVLLEKVVYDEYS